MSVSSVPSAPWELIRSSASLCPQRNRLDAVTQIAFNRLLFQLIRINTNYGNSVIDRQRACGDSCVDHFTPPEARVHDDYGVFVVQCHLQRSAPVIAKFNPMIAREQSCNGKLEVFIRAHNTKDVALNGSVGCRIQTQLDTPLQALVPRS